MIENLDKYLEDKLSLEKSLRKILFLILFGITFTILMINNLFYGKYLFGILDNINILRVQHSADTLDSSISKIYSELTLAAESSVIINSFINADEVNKSEAVLQSIIKRTSADYVYVLDSHEMIVSSLDARGNEPNKGRKHKKNDLFTLVEAGQPVLNIEDDCLIMMVPIKYYSGVLGFIELVILNKNLFNLYLTKDYKYELSEFELFYNNFYLIGSSKVSNPATEKYFDVNLYQYSSENPFNVFVVEVVLGVLFFLIVILVLSLYVSKEISKRIVTPIKKLVNLITKSDENNVSRCFPLGADKELEFLALAFDKKTDQLIEVNSSLEKKVQQRTQEYLVQKEKAEESLKLRSEFIANMSHEIRTPLNGIIGNCDLLAEQLIDTKHTEKIVTIQKSGDLLLSIINDILDFSKIESKKVKLEKIPFLFVDIIKQVSESLKDQAILKDLTINKYLDEKFKDQYLLGDPTRLTQILFNLVGNAIKFTKSGHVDIELVYEKLDDDSLIVHLSVQDTGIGISPENIKNLFSAFQQADGSITRRFGGSGLGLTITKELVHLMGGTIEVSSVLGEGSNFHIKLPFQIASEKNNTLIEDDNEINTNSNLKILLAEDNKVNQQLFVAYLDSLGLTCDVAMDGLQALEAAQKSKYDIIFMDMQMPNMDGIQSTIEIRKLENHLDTRIVALTANAFNEHKENCIQAGMNDYLSKPLRKKELVKLINRISRK